MGEDICKQCNQQGINLQYVQTTHETWQQTNNLLKKCADDLNRYFSKDIHRVKKHMKDGQYH